MQDAAVPTADAAADNGGNRGGELVDAVRTASRVLVAIAAAPGVDPSSTTRLCDRLSRAGLVRRQRLPADRRAVKVTLSPAGRDLVAEVTRRRREEFEHLLGDLPVGQHELVVSALRAIAEPAGEVPERDMAIGPGWS